MSKLNVTIERLPNGAWQVSDLVRGYLVTRTYYGYTKRDAVTAYGHYVMDLIKSGELRHA